MRLETFELRKAVESPKGKRAQGSTNEETKQTLFDGTIPRRLVSKDNFDVVWHFPNAIGPRGTVGICCTQNNTSTHCATSPTAGACRHGLQRLGGEGEKKPEGCK